MPSISMKPLVPPNPAPPAPREPRQVGPGAPRAHAEHLHEAARPLQPRPPEGPEQLLGAVARHQRSLRQAHDQRRRFVHPRAPGPCGFHPRSFRGFLGPYRPLAALRRPARTSCIPATVRLHSRLTLLVPYSPECVEGQFSETQLCISEGGLIASPYFGAIDRTLFKSPSSKGGGEDLSSAGTLTSSKNFSIPAGVSIARCLAGLVPTFL